jgi:hypothetical protein
MVAISAMAPARSVVLAAFLGVCVFADASPLLKLRPPSVVLGVLIGASEGARASACFALLALGAVAAPAITAGWVARRRPLPEGRRALLIYIGLIAAMLAATWFFGPRESGLRAMGRGSDQEACIVMPARALASGHWPYDRALIWSGNPCSPGMGWILLAAPFVLLSGYASFLVAGAAAFLFAPARLIDPRTKLRFLLLTLSCVTAWQSLATGADTLAIGIALALLTALSDEPRLTMIVAVLAGLVASARLPLAFFPLLLAACLDGGGPGERKRARLFGIVAMGTLALAHGVPLAIDARSYLHDGPFHVLHKSEDMRLLTEGGTTIFVGCGLLWLTYAIRTLRRARGRTTPANPLTRQFDVATLTLLSILAPTLTDLLARLNAASLGFEEDLAAWQGGNWILLALPSYAASAALAFRPPEARRD